MSKKKNRYKASFTEENNEFLPFFINKESTKEPKKEDNDYQIIIPSEKRKEDSGKNTSTLILQGSKPPSRRKMTSLELANKLYSECIFKRYNNEIFIFDEDIYKHADTPMLVRHLAMMLNEEDLMHLSVNNLRDAVEMFFLRYKDKIKKAQISKGKILFNNGYFDIEKHEFVQRTIDDFATFKVNASYFPDQQIKTPAFKKMVNNITDGDDAIKKLIYEFLGYMLLQENNINTFFLIGGAKNSGKTTFCRLIEKLIGKEHTSHVELQKFENDANVMSMTGKAVNIQYNAMSTIIRNRAVFNFNSYISDNSVGGKCIIEAYQPLKLQKCDSMFWDMMTVIPFFNSATEENKNLINELWAERDGIVQKAVKGARRLLENNYTFTDCATAELFKTQWQHHETAVIDAFIEACCIIDRKPETRTHTADLYDAYLEFCLDACIDAVTENAFSRTLKGAYDLKTFRCKNGGKKPLHGFSGICLRNAN